MVKKMWPLFIAVFLLAIDDYVWSVDHIVEGKKHFNLDMPLKTLNYYLDHSYICDKSVSRWHKKGQNVNQFRAKVCIENNTQKFFF